MPDDFDLDAATSAEIRAEYQAWEKRVREWKATHETPSAAELIADERTMADAPFNPNAETEAGML